jgi:4'-phosphopantetheinyl transferase
VLFDAIEEEFFLDTRHVHAGIFELSASTEIVEYFRTQLDADEIARAQKFHFPHLQISYVIAHGMLRCLLASYLKAIPAQVNFRYGEHGKPDIADPDCGLRFNLSHSGSIAACALGVQCDVGVDVEQVRAMPDLLDIAHRFFSSEECKDLETVPAGDREVAFFNCWTRKEAYVKAVGGGLSIPLDSFRVSLLPGDSPRLLRYQTEDGVPWTIEAFDPGPGYCGALAYSGAPRQVVVRRTTAAKVLCL